MREDGDTVGGLLFPEENRCCSAPKVFALVGKVSLKRQDPRIYSRTSFGKVSSLDFCVTNFDSLSVTASISLSSSRARVTLKS